MRPSPGHRGHLPADASPRSGPLRRTGSAHYSGTCRWPCRGPQSATETPTPPGLLGRYRMRPIHDARLRLRLLQFDEGRHDRWILGCASVAEPGEGVLGLVWAICRVPGRSSNHPTADTVPYQRCILWAQPELCDQSGFNLPRRSTVEHEAQRDGTDVGDGPALWKRHPQVVGPALGEITHRANSTTERRGSVRPDQVAQSALLAADCVHPRWGGSGARSYPLKSSRSPDRRRSRPPLEAGRAPAAAGARSRSRGWRVSRQGKRGRQLDARTCGAHVSIPVLSPASS